jgi:hypothetical protein
MTMIPEILDKLPGISTFTGLYEGTSAFALQLVDNMGGIEVVALLAVIGFILGLVACIAYGGLEFIER